MAIRSGRVRRVRRARRQVPMHAVQVRVLLLAGVPGGGVEERPQGDMQADPADAEDQEIILPCSSAIEIIVLLKVELT